MSLTSRLAAAEDGLLAAIQGRSELAGVAIRLGDPGSAPRPEHIWIVEAATAERVTDVTPQATNAGGYDERFELSVRVLATRSGDDYAALRDRAMELCAAIENAVIEDRRLGGAVEDSEVVRLERETGATENGRGILSTVVVEGRAWLA
jgi:hypothetical protein